MKKHVVSILTILALLLMVGQADAQLSFNKGVKVGYQSSNLEIDSNDLSNLTSRAGFTAGGFLELDLLGPLDFQAELLYSQKGTGFELMQEDVDLRLNYLEVPVLAKFTLLKLPVVSFNIQGGMYWASKLGEDFEPSTFNYFPDDFFKNSDTGFTVGVGTKFNLALVKVLVDARYSKGTADISEENPEVQNQAFLLTAGVAF